MGKFLTPIIMVTSVFLVLTGLVFFNVAPGNPLVVALFLLLLGITLAGALTLGIYFLRRFWGPKDSPRYLLRDAMRQGLIISLGVTVFLLLQIFNAVNPVTLVIIVGLTLAFERLT